MTGYTPLSVFDLIVTAGLLLANGAVLLYFGIRLERSLIIAALRMLLQLLLLAVALKFILAQTSAIWSILFIGIAAAAAIIEIRLRQQHTFRRWPDQLLVASPAVISGLIVTLLAVTLIQPSPWYTPRVLLPILGMLLGNALIGAALVVDAITFATVRHQREIEARLALGETRYEAFSDILHHSLRTALMPVAILMATAGVVTLPGMMTGQILAGIDPLEAAKYQIMILLLIAATTCFATIGGALLSVRLLMDDRDRLRLDRLNPSTIPHGRSAAAPGRWTSRLRDIASRARR